MRRWLKLLWAHVACDYYLLTVGMWIGECKILLYGLDHKVSLIGTCTGSFFKKNVKLKRVFYQKET
jgi:hypothetical protein